MLRTQKNLLLPSLEENKFQLSNNNTSLAANITAQKPQQVLSHPNHRLS